MLSSRLVRIDGLSSQIRGCLRRPWHISLSRIEHKARKRSLLSDSWQPSRLHCSCTLPLRRNWREIDMKDGDKTVGGAPKHDEDVNAERKDTSSSSPSASSTSMPLESSSSTAKVGNGNGHTANRLAKETSPYLLSHSQNPVDWYPWGPEALAKAKEEDKPIFLSVGYSACHWCHVLERESFENPAIAALMNKHFINIKVDREERPDIDAIYMQAVVTTTGGGGWPMSVWCTPDAKPFYAGTYFPPEDRRGMPGFRRITESLAQVFQTERETVEGQAQAIVQAIKQNLPMKKVHSKRPEQPKDSAAAAEGGDDQSDTAEGAQVASGWPLRITAERSLVDVEFLDDAAQLVLSKMDKVRGGTRGAPKFPQPMIGDFLLRVFRRLHSKAQGTGGIEELRLAEEILCMLTLTLDKMADGGMYDQVGGGFHRYSTDALWLAPHFEKMLYDNAQLVSLYTHTYQMLQSLAEEGSPTARGAIAKAQTSNDDAGAPLRALDDADDQERIQTAIEQRRMHRYKTVVDETLEYVMREMWDSKTGAFYSAQDADSEGEEGKFFVWGKAEIESILGGSEKRQQQQQQQQQQRPQQESKTEEVYDEEHRGAAPKVPDEHEDKRESPSLLTEFCEALDVTEDGNWEGKTILWHRSPLEEVAVRLNVEVEGLEKRLQRAKARLYEARETRVKPFRDEKVLTAWNALMLEAFADAGRVMRREDFTEVAIKNATFLLTTLRDTSEAREGELRLLRTYKDGQAKLKGYLEDYAFLAHALLSLYRTTFDSRWFVEAQALLDTVLQHFPDRRPGGAGFYDTADDHEELIVRPKELQDNATPSGNSSAARALLLMAEYTGSGRYYDAAEDALRGMEPLLVAYPTGFANWLSAMDFGGHEIVKVSIVGDPRGRETQKMLDFVCRGFHPHCIVAFCAPEEVESSPVPLLRERAEVIRSMRLTREKNGTAESGAGLAAGEEGKEGSGRAVEEEESLCVAFVCRGHSCSLPITSTEALEEELRHADGS